MYDPYFQPPAPSPRVFVKRTNDAGSWQSVQPGTTIGSLLKSGETGLIRGQAKPSDYVLSDGDVVSVKFAGHDNG